MTYLLGNDLPDHIIQEIDEVQTRIKETGSNVQPTDRKLLLWGVSHASNFLVKYPRFTQFTQDLGDLERKSTYPDAMTPNRKIFSQKFLNGKRFKIEEEPKQYDLEPSEEEEKSFSDMNEDEQYDYFCVEPMKTQP